MTPTQAQTLSKPALLAAELQLFVADIAAAREFYTKKLGFSVAFSYGEPPFYGQVFRDGARLNLRCLDKPGLDPERRDSKQLLSASITLDDAKPLSARRRPIRAAGSRRNPGVLERSSCATLTAI